MDQPYKQKTKLIYPKDSVSFQYPLISIVTTRLYNPVFYATFQTTRNTSKNQG